MGEVRHLLKVKGYDVWKVSPETTVFEALGLMAEKNVGSVLVLEDNRLVGILSERDYARKVVLMGKTSKDTPVRDIMTREVTCVSPENSIEECMELMTERRIRHLPVLEHDRITGLISIGDVVKAIISDQEFLIGQLRNYISGVR